MRDEVQTDRQAHTMRIGIATSRYHGEITDALFRGARELFLDAGGAENDLVIVSAPGSFELTAICRALAMREDLDAVVAIGCVIRGETMHDQYICQSVATGLGSISVQTGKPVCFGLLTCSTMHQARERAGGEKGNKGAEAMAAAIDTVTAIRSVQAAQESLP